VAVDRRPPPPVPGGTVLRWGIPDFVIAWIAGVIVGAIAAAPFAPAAGAPKRDDVASTVVALFVQSFVSLGVAWWISNAKGRRSLTTDFGFRWDWRDSGWVVGGVVLAYLAAAALYPLNQLLPSNSGQAVVDTFKASTGGETALFVIGVLLVAPTVEELLFRGMLLRGLLRRIPPGSTVTVSALVFAVVHPLLDPSLGTVVAVPALFALGLLSGYEAVRTGGLSRSIALHAGFNLLTVVSVLTSR